MFISHHTEPCAPIKLAYGLGIITLVDAKHCTPHIDEEKPEGVENEAQEQVAFADVLVLNKTDLGPVGLNC